MNRSPEALIAEIEQELSNTVWPHLVAIERQAFERVLKAFTQNRVGEEHFYSVNGYGHNDLGREVTDRVFAHALQAEAALVRMQIVSGTHAIAIALNGCLNAGDRLLSITGRPYDTLEEVIGLRGDSAQSLKSRGVQYDEISIFQSFNATAGQSYDSADNPLDACVYFNSDEALKIGAANVIFIQRSRGYSMRPSLTIQELSAIIRQVKTINPAVIVMVDNCYGEFTEAQEPPEVGADLIAGSLIKNPGGGIVPAGGYVAGRQDLIDRCADVLTCPGVGAEGGYMFDLTRTILQGIFMAPGVVHQVLKGMTLAAKVFETLGYETTPHWQERRSDIIQIIQLGNPEKMVKFCQVLQAVSPIASNVMPVPSRPPGYADEVVMAGGTFVDGSTIELSADGPLRPPYSVFLQGGITYAHTRYAMQQILAQAF